MELRHKLGILADTARHGASCVSSVVEGLLPGSGIAGRTRERLAQVAQHPRGKHGRQGCPQLGTIPEAGPLSLGAAGRCGDRLACGIRLPREIGLLARA